MIETVSPRVTRFARTDPSGWTVDMLTVDLGDGALVYSPTSFGEETRALVERVGAPRVLVAPNHYHHLSLDRQAFCERLMFLVPAGWKVMLDEADDLVLERGLFGVEVKVHD